MQHKRGQSASRLSVLVYRIVKYMQFDSSVNDLTDNPCCVRYSTVCAMKNRTYCFEHPLGNNPYRTEEYMFVPLGWVAWFFRILHILTGHEPSQEHGCHKIALDPDVIRSVKPEDIAIEIVRSCIKNGKHHRSGMREEIELPPIMQPRRGTELCERYEEFPGLLERALEQEDIGRFTLTNVSSDVVIFRRI